MNVDMAVGTICMFHIGRSGSTVLGDLLGQNPYVRWEGEIFAQDRGIWNDMDDPTETIGRRAAMRRRSLYGFEVRHSQIGKFGGSLERVAAAFRAHGIGQYLILRRNNYLRVVASALLASMTGRFHRARLDEPPAKATKIRFGKQIRFFESDPIPLPDLFSEFDRFYAELDRSLEGADVLRLTYEADIAVDPRFAYRKACRWLEVAPMPSIVRLGVTTPYTLRDAIEDFDDIAALLKGSAWEWMLEA